MLTCAELREELTSRDLPTYGNKAVLEARLRAAGVAVGSTENNLIIGENGIAAHRNTNAWTSALIQRNVHISTRRTYLAKQRKMVVWALTQPNLKDHVHDGLIVKEGLKLMANDPAYFLTFLTWINFEDEDIPAEFDVDDSDSDE